MKTILFFIFSLSTVAAAVDYSELSAAILFQASSGSDWGNGRACCKVPYGAKPAMS